MAAEHRRNRHHRHLNRREFDRDPTTHVYRGGFYLAPWDSGYYTAQNPHPSVDCADPSTCEAHAGDPTAATGADAGADAGGMTGGTV